MRSYSRSMSGSLSHLLAAVAFFVGGHFVFSSIPVRTGFIRSFGDQSFRALYSLLAGAGMIWVVYAFNGTPYQELWPQSEGLRLVPYVLMPFAMILAVSGFTTRNVTLVGGESAADDPHPTPGIMTITRHPFLNGVLLWAVGHVISNGDAASLVMFGGFCVLAVGGMIHIDYRRGRTLGSAWGPIAMTTSAVPFLAALQGRTNIDWAGIGLWRVAVGLILYGVVIYGHDWISGVAVWPI